MNRFMRSTALFLSVLIVSVAVVQSGEKTFDQTFQVTDGGTLTLKTDVGSVEIVGVEGGKEVSVHALVKGRQRDMDEFEITARTTAAGVEVTGRSLRAKHLWNFWGDDLDVSFSVKVPKEYNLTVCTSGGDIAITGVNGKIDGETSGGNLTLTNVHGAISLETSGGDIRAEKVEGMLHMATSGGDIRVGDVKGDVDVSTSGGDIALGPVEGKVRAETSGGNITVRVQQAYKGVHAETSGGDIDIVLPANIAATIDAGTSGGEVVCDLPVTITGKIDERRIRGSVNGGGQMIYAHTSGGDVRIRSVK
jgi:hypothetical protein